MKKRIMALLLSAAMACGMVSLVGCTSSSGSDSNVIKIGVFEPLTGENGGGGSQEVDGIKYANKVYPEVLGKKVELVIIDNKSDKGEATTAATRLVEKEGVKAVIGSYGSGVSIAAGETFKNAKIPAMGASCTNPMVTQGNDFYFRACYIDPFQGTVMANYAIQQGAKKAAIITQNGDDYSTGLGSFFKQAFIKLTGDENSIVSENVFQTNEQDFNAILTNVKASAPDVIFAPSSIATAPLIIKQARAFGIKSLKGFSDLPTLTRIVSAGSISFPVVSFVIPVVTLILLLILLYIVNHTKIGMAMRAVSEDFETAKLMGVMPGLKCFIAAVFGGIGNIKGAVLGGGILGISESMLVAFLPNLTGYRDAFAFILLIVVLLVKPSGLLGERTTEKV